MLVTVKSREIQRGMLAEARGDATEAARHFKAAAHLELVLADDYRRAGDNEPAFRSQISAASCLWRAEESEQARTVLDSLCKQFPDRADAARLVLSELQSGPNNR